VEEFFDFPKINTRFMRKSILRIAISSRNEMAGRWRFGYNAPAAGSTYTIPELHFDNIDFTAQNE
jgi:hypothetical protein